MGVNDGGIKRGDRANTGDLEAEPPPELPGQASGMPGEINETEEPAPANPPTSEAEADLPPVHRS